MQNYIKFRMFFSQCQVGDKSDIACKYAFIPTDAVAFGNAHFGAGSGTIHLHIVSCTGGETNLTACPEIRSNVYCLRGHSEDAGVRCQGLKKSITVLLFLSDNYTTHRRDHCKKYIIAK